MALGLVLEQRNGECFVVATEKDVVDVHI